jgi:hypothetical protein
MVVSFRKRIMIGWAVVGAFLAIAVSGTTAFGASPPAPAPVANGTYQATAEAQHAQDIINLLDPYVVRVGDGTLALNAPSSVSNKVGAATMNRVRSGMALVNGEIRAGRLVATANHHLYDPKYSALSVQGGWTGVRWYWWGFRIFLSEYYTQKFMAALAIGAGLFALCAAIPALANQVVCGVLAALVAIFAGIIWLVDNGNGVYFTHTYWGSNWINAQ